MKVPENGFEDEFIHFVLLKDPQQVPSFGGTEYQTSLQPEIFPNSHQSEPRLSVAPTPNELEDGTTTLSDEMSRGFHMLGPAHKAADTRFARVSTHTSNANHARTINS